jgi:hypothetical protein
MHKEIQTRRGIGWQMRLVFVGFGLWTALYGYAKVHQGIWYYKNYRRDDVPALFAVAFGILLILFAIFPWGYIGFLWEGPRKKKRFR